MHYSHTMQNQIPEDLKDEWESYIDCCYSLGVEPSQKSFIRYNQYYRNYGIKSESSSTHSES